VGYENVKVAVPGATAYTTPLPVPMVATEMALLAHAPPTPLARVMVAPAQTVLSPVIGGGKG